MASFPPSTPHPPLSASHVASARLASEQRLGILFYVSPVDFGYEGDIRKRYTDFIVNEVRKDGTVVHLEDFQQAPRSAGQPFNGSHVPNINASRDDKPQFPIQANGSADNRNGPALAEIEPVPISEADTKILEDLVGAEASRELCALDEMVQKKDKTSRNVTVNFPPITDRAQRTKVHQEVRRIFSSRIETQVGAMGVITASALALAKGPSSNHNNVQRQFGQRQPSNPGHGSWRGPYRGEPRAHRGEYLHFTLYKENKDTMDAVNHIARMLKIKATNFGFAGTKDRRAATVQRISVKNKSIGEVNSLNDKMSGIRVGDFSYQKKPMQLGQHGGNEFVIVLKNVALARGNNYSLAHRLRATEECVQAAMDSVIRNGFLNYFGLQRFGTHAIGTQEVGMKILKDDFMGAVDAILHVEPELASLAVSEGANDGRFHKDEFDRARAIAIWKMSGNSDAATRMLPKKYGAEFNLIRHLGRSPSDFCGALMSITRGLRNLYIHAYQSYVWNFVASERWAKYGSRVIKGDLVLLDPDATAPRSPSAQDMSEDRNQEEEEFFQQARFLSEEEAASGRYSIFDVVLPIPGYDIIYPDNDIGEFYVEFMGRVENGALNPYDMRRRQREFSLSGHYRKLLATFTASPKFAVRAYSDDEQQMHPTDRDIIEYRKRVEGVKNRESAAPWNHFSQNARAFDDDVRRKNPQSPTDPPTETRISDAWVETGLDGGKRIKVADRVQQELFSPPPSARPEQAVNSETEGGSQPPSSTAPQPAGPSRFRKLDLPPLAIKAGLGGGVNLTAGSADVDMIDSALPPTSSEVKHENAHADESSTSMAVDNDTTRHSSVPHAELLTYLENHLKSAANETAHVSSVLPQEAVASGSVAQTSDTSPSGSLVEPSKSPTGSVFDAPAKTHVGSGGIETVAAPTQGSPSGAFFNAARRTPVEGRFEVPKTPVANIFEDCEGFADPRHPAVNVSRKLPGAKPHDSKIAVILNFRLNASNYATICIREMTGHASSNQ